MYTGLNLSEDFDVRVRQTQAANYLTLERKQTCVNMAVISLIERNYALSASQTMLDEISPLAIGYREYTPNNNMVLLKPLHISNIVLASGTLYNITFDRPHNLPATWTGSITISDVEGTLLFSNINGVRSATYINSTTIQVNVAGLTGVYTANTGQVISNDNSWISDYYHLMAVNVHAIVNLNLTISAVNIGTSTQITVEENNLRTGEYLYFSNFGGLTGLNTWKYIKKITDNTIRLYNDAGLTTPSVVTGSYTSGGTISRKYKRGCEQLVSSQKIGYYGAAEIDPLYTITENKLICYTSDMNLSPYITQDKYIVDYITTYADIDLENDTTDLLQTFNMNFMRNVLEEAALIFYKINTSVADVQISAVK